MSDAVILPANRSYESISIGDEAAFSRVIGEAEVEAFAGLTGDRNPLHMDQAYAAGTRFGGRIAHGMLVAAYFSTLVGMHLPGRRAVYLTQDVQFAKPVRLGQQLTFRGRVKRKTDSLRLVEIETSATDDAGDVVVRGRAQVMMLP